MSNNEIHNLLKRLALVRTTENAIIIEETIENKYNDLYNKLAEVRDILESAATIPHYAYGDNEAACDMAHCIEKSLEILGE